MNGDEAVKQTAGIRVTCRILTSFGLRDGCDQWFSARKAALFIHAHVFFYACPHHV